MRLRQLYYDRCCQIGTTIPMEIHHTNNRKTCQRQTSSMDLRSDPKKLIILPKEMVCSIMEWDTSCWQGHLHKQSNKISPNPQRIESLLLSHEEHILIQDRCPFHISIEDWPKMLANYMKPWILVNTPFLKQCLTVAKLHTNFNSSDIEVFVSNKP
jgi:hypothetical protein